MDMTAELARTELFQDVGDDLLDLVVSRTEPVTLSAGDVLLSPERENFHVYLLLSGTLGLYFNSRDSPEIRELAAGVSVGEMSVIDSTKPSAYVVAKERSQVLPLHRDLMEFLVQGNNPIARNLLRLMTRWIRENTQRIVLDQEQLWELSHHANVDGLTGLYNRRWLDNAFGRLLEQSRKEDPPGPLCVFMIDVDHFKKYNDANGHRAGDRALMALGDVLKTTLRPYDFSARYGGEEFLVLMPNTPEGQGVEVAERLRLAVERKAVTMPEGVSLPQITISIGLAMNDTGATPESMIGAADAQLYRAKEAGRNRICHRTTG
jgi:diguanylate cyclase (GGDEF)-like protein